MNECAGKRLLILGGAAFHLKLVRAAQEMGVYTIVTDYLDPADSPCKQIADKSYQINIFDIDRIVEMCKAEKVDGVLSAWIDACQEPYQKVCERLGLPCYCTAEQVHKLTDKEAFKACCEAYGVDVIPGYTVQELYDKQTHIEFPLLIKPARSRGSRGITICNTITEACAAVEAAEKCSENGRVIIEKYMGSADDFGVVYLLADGEPYLLRTFDGYQGDPELGLDKLRIISMSPSKHMQLYAQNVHPKVVNMIHGLGIKNGPVFLQGFVDGNTVRFYDPAIRFPGSEMDMVNKHVLGLDVMKMMVGFALEGCFSHRLGRLEHDPAFLNGKVGCYLAPSIRPGQIAEINGFEEVCNFPEVLYATSRHKIGDVVKETHDVAQLLCEFIILCDSSAQCREVLERIRSLIHVIDMNGKEMLVNFLTSSELFGG